MKTVLSFLVLLSTPAIAQTGLEKARLAKTMYSAFECGNLAVSAEDPASAERLYDLGIKSGRAFLQAVQANQIPKELFESEVPVGVSWSMQGPSHDFIIGRIFEGAAAYVAKTLSETDSGYSYDKGRRKLEAQNRFTKANCSLIR